MDSNQLAARKQGLGGSDMVAICGASRYTAPIDVWRDKLGHLPDWEGNERTEWGTRLEPLVADHYAELSGLTLYEPPTLYYPDRPWHLGTPDRLCFDSASGPRGTIEPLPGLPYSAFALIERLGHCERGLEIKTHGHYAGTGYGEEGTDDIPDDKRIQIAWYQALDLTTSGEFDLATLVDSHLYSTYRIGRDYELESYLLEEAEKFWHLVQTETPPDPDGSESFSRYLHDRFASHKGELVEADANAREVADRYLAARQAEKDAITFAKLQAQLLQSIIGPNAGLTLDGQVIATWKRQARGRVSTAALHAEIRRLYGIHDDEWTALEDKFRGEPIRDFRVKKGTK